VGQWMRIRQIIRGSVDENTPDYSWVSG